MRFVFPGGPVLARGGSGDILAGIAGSLVARAPKDLAFAGAAAALWHGLAAESLARRHGQTAESLPAVTAKPPFATAKPPFARPISSTTSPQSPGGPNNTGPSQSHFPAHDHFIWPITGARPVPKCLPNATLFLSADKNNVVEFQGDQPNLAGAPAGKRDKNFNSC